MESYTEDSLRNVLLRNTKLLLKNEHSIDQFLFSITAFNAIMKVEFTTSNRDQYGPHSTTGLPISHKADNYRPGQEISYCMFKTVFRPACHLSLSTSVHLSPQVYKLHLRDPFRCAPKSLPHNRALLLTILSQLISNFPHSFYIFRFFHYL